MKRTVKITVRITPGELETIQRFVQKEWPELKGLLSMSDTLRSLSLIAAKGYNPRSASPEPSVRE